MKNQETETNAEHQKSVMERFFDEEDCIEAAKKYLDEGNPRLDKMKFADIERLDVYLHIRSILIDKHAPSIFLKPDDCTYIVKRGFLYILSKCGTIIEEKSATYFINKTIVGYDNIIPIDGQINITKNMGVNKFDRVAPVIRDILDGKFPDYNEQEELQFPFGENEKTASQPVVVNQESTYTGRENLRTYLHKTLDELLDVIIKYM